MSNGYRYTGSGERFRGVPARDLTQDEFDRLGPLEQRRVTESGVYRQIELTDLSMDDLRAMALKAGADAEALEKMRAKADVIKAINDAAAAANPRSNTPAEDAGNGKEAGQ